MTSEEDTTKLNHIVYVVNVRSEFGLYYLFEIFVHVYVVKKDVVAEMLFVVCTASCTMIHISVCKHLSWPASCVSY